MASINDILADDGHRGIICNMPRPEYRAINRLNPSSLSAGLLGSYEIDVRAIKEAFDGPDTTRAAASQDRLDRGTLAHLALLQPERLHADVAVWTGAVRRGAAWDVFQEMHGGKLIIRDEDYTATMQTVNQLRSHPMVSRLLNEVEPEVAVFSREVVDGVTLYCRGQLDGIRRGEQLIVDIKTTEAGIDRRSVERTIRDFRYREKMALYRRWIARETNTEAEDWRCWNLFLGMGDHTGIRAVKFTTSAMEWGEMRMGAAIEKVAKCLAADSWPLFAVDDVMDVAPWEIEEDEVVIHD